MTEGTEEQTQTETRHEDAIMRLVDELASAARDAGWWASAPHMANAATAAEKRGTALREQIVSALTAARAEREEAVKALTAAHEALSSHHGLLATDQPDGYGDALREGCDASAAWKCFREECWTIDEAPVLAQIDAVLRSLEGQRDAE